MRPLRAGHNRAFIRCRTHQNCGYYDYVPFSFSTAVGVMACGCDTKGQETITEAQFLAASTPKALDLLKLAEDVAMGRVKALSIKQPYPHHIFHDGKDVENRDWPTKGRGWFIVHAGKTSDGALPKALTEAPRGGIVGMARIVDCVEQMDSKWFFGRYGFVLADAFPVPLIPCRGQLGFFAPPQDALYQLATSIRAHAAGEVPA